MFRIWVMLVPLQRVSTVVEMYQELPLSATIRPCFLRASRIVFAAPVYPEMSLLAFSLRRSPMGGRLVFADPAWWRAG